MEVTDAMLAAAMKKAVELELLPKHLPSNEAYVKVWDAMKEVLQAAQAAALN